MARKWQTALLYQDVLRAVAELKGISRGAVVTLIKMRPGGL
ncbi:MAG: hypothetical protein ACOX42_05400 [Clostridia bacterium]